MASKNERFEMRLGEDVLEKIDRWRSGQADLPTRSEAVRRLVEMGLTQSSTRESVRFSDGEKMLMVMMRDIFKGLNITHSEIDPDFVEDVIIGGHYWAPKWEYGAIFHDEVDDPRDLRMVVDVLDMWSFIEEGYGVLSSAEKERVKQEAEPFGDDVQFIGFDGNNETGHMSIALFLVEKMRRFVRFRGRELNSHAPMIDRYQRMCEIFAPMRRTLVGTNLNADQIIELLKALRRRA